MSAEPHLSDLTATVKVRLSPDEQVHLIHLAGDSGWRHLRLASSLLTEAVARTKSIRDLPIKDTLDAPGDSLITIPVAVETKRALIGLVGSERLAYTSVATALLSQALNSKGQPAKPDAGLS
jgi:hypothetical protein